MASTIAMSAIRPVAFTAQPAKPTQRVASVNNKVVATPKSFMVWTPVNNKFFETFSFLPPLSDGEITKQVDYIVRNGWTPCLEFSDSDNAYVNSTNAVRFGDVSCNYFDNRYWTMWKLPMFGCQDGAQVLGEISKCTKAFPDAYIRLVAFDAVRQVQVAGFLVHRPKGSNDFQAPANRSV